MGPSVLLSSCKIICSAVNKVNIIRSLWPIFLSDVLFNIGGSWQNFRKSSQREISRKSTKYESRWCKWRDRRRTDRYDDDNERFLHLNGRETTKTGKGALLNLKIKKRKYGNKNWRFIWQQHSEIWKFSSLSLFFKMLFLYCWIKPLLRKRFKELCYLEGQTAGLATCLLLTQRTIHRIRETLPTLKLRMLDTIKTNMVQNVRCYMKQNSARSSLALIP